MSGYKISRTHPPQRRRLGFRRKTASKTTGQALLEYALILALVVLAILAVLAITGPAVGNVFSNQVYNLLGGQVQPYNTLAPNDFWTQVAAVASYTPDSPGLTTNTPAPATNTPTVGPSPTPSPITPSPMPTNTPTPGPSPTPPDQNFGYPFVDTGDHPDWWQHDFDNLITNPWNAEYWNYTAWKTDMTSMPAGSGIKRETVSALDNDWASGVAPSSGVSENFYARYTTTVNLENKQYAFHIKFNSGIRIWVDASLVVDNIGGKPTWAAESGNTLIDKWQDVKFTGGQGTRTITVEFVDPTQAASLHVFLVEDGNLDTGTCHWALSNEQSYSPPTAWSDSPGTSFAPKSYCVLSLRGTIDLTGATAPKLQFYDRYDLFNSNAKAVVSVSVAGSGNWTDVTLHNNTTDLTWARQTYDLTQFSGQDYRGKTIEVRFVLDATLTTSTGKDGWWIDDIHVEEEYPRLYTVGFIDDMEGTSHWYPGGTWARSNEASHSATTAWSDSPGANYIAGTNSTLELDGKIDLTDPRVVTPQLVFWHRYNLNTGDYIYAEVSTDRTTWTALPSGGKSYLAYQSTQWAWTQEILDLNSYKGQRIYFRFRLDARTDGNVADGWWIDDFELRNKPEAVIYLDWCDGMESGGSNWVPEGTWGVINGSDYDPAQTYNATTYPHSGSAFWSDSPGADYQHNTNSSLQLKPKVDLSTSTNPEVVFWQQWDLGYSDDIYLEVSTDDGISWTSIWQFTYNALPVGYGCSGCTIVKDPDYNHVLSWTRESVSLKTYVGQRINIRFRLDATYDPAVDNGWFLDDICFQEHTTLVRKVPFYDGFESGVNNWYAGGRWSLSSENVNPRLTGSIAMSDSPGGLYNHLSNAILELKGVVDLKNTVLPTLYYWDTFDIATQDYAVVEVNVSDDSGTTWGGWREITLVRRRTTTTRSWDRRQVDLSPYIPNATYPNRVIRIRFRLYAANNPATGDGWWIDEVSIVDRNGQEPNFTLPFFDSVDYVNNYWVFDGTWDRVPMFRMVGSGSGLGPGTWTGKYYYDANSNHVFDSGEYRFTYPGIDQLNFNWGTGRPTPPTGSTESPLPSNDYYLIRWTRTINIGDNNTQLTINTYSDDGIRVLVDPPGNTSDPNWPNNVAGYPNSWSWNINAWVDRGYPGSPDTTTVTLNQGLHTILVEYYESTGSAQVLVDFGKWGSVFHDSPNTPTTLIPYLDKSDMSVTLEGTIDLTGSTLPTLTYEDRRLLGNDGDTVYTEVSKDGGFNWVAVASRTGTSTNWTKRFIDLSAYVGQKISIRFRLDARSPCYSGQTCVNDGWYIDNITVAE